MLRFPSFPIYQEARLLFSQPGVANASARKAAINKALEALASSSSSYSSRSPAVAAAASEQDEEEDPLPEPSLDHPKDFVVPAAGPREARTASASASSSVDSPPSIAAAAASAVAVACEEPYGRLASLPIERKGSVAELAARFSGNGGGVFSSPGVFRSSTSGAGVSSAPTGGVTTTTTTQQLQVRALARDYRPQLLRADQ